MDFPPSTLLHNLLHTAELFLSHSLCKYDANGDDDELKKNYVLVFMVVGVVNAKRRISRLSSPCITERAND